MTQMSPSGWLLRARNPQQPSRHTHRASSPPHLQKHQADNISSEPAQPLSHTNRPRTSDPVPRANQTARLAPIAADLTSRSRSQAKRDLRLRLVTRLTHANIARLSAVKTALRELHDAHVSDSMRQVEHTLVATIIRALCSAFNSTTALPKPTSPQPSDARTDCVLKTASSPGRGRGLKARFSSPGFPENLPL